MSEEIKKYLSKIGTKGGSVKTPVKAKASAKNGAKGGRPKSWTVTVWDGRPWANPTVKKVRESLAPINEKMARGYAKSLANGSALGLASAGLGRCDLTRGQEFKIETKNPEGRIVFEGTFKL